MSNEIAPVIFGIRHHGPGSARSLKRALMELEPDILLIEGPPDAADVLPLAANPDMVPPVALLVYVPTKPEQAVFYPFAPFSPEWIAIRHGTDHSIPIRFMDLPQSHQMAISEDPASFDLPAGEMEVEEAEPPLPDEVELLRNDPLRLIAQGDGFGDSERWWEYMVEERKDGNDLFAAILSLMSTLREEVERSESEEGSGNRMESFNAKRERLREAYMRKTIRAAQKEGYQRIAVVCGAWHAPALSVMPPAKEDTVILKKLPSVKTSATWIPWTYGRLAFSSGYGAGLASPGYYHHIWESPGDVTTRWMTQTAHLLREADLAASPAGTIEAVRLAETLAALRARHTPGLEELLEASRSVFCFGADGPMDFIRTRLLINDRIGSVPADTPSIPLYQDILRIQKRLRLQPTPEAKELVLDLRKEFDLERSRFLHRLTMIGISWGYGQNSYGTGTFREVWQLQWQPEFVVKIMEAGLWGATLFEAAHTCAIEGAKNGTKPAEMTTLIGLILSADLREAIEPVVSRLHNLAAMTGDVLHLMEALPSLATIVRYGNVRGTDTGMVAQVMAGIVTRTAIGLVPASFGLNDEAAEEMFTRLTDAHSAVVLIQDRELLEIWNDALQRLSAMERTHGLIAGRCCRLLFDQQILSSEETGRMMGLRLSPSSPPPEATAWIDGFIRNSGQVLVHDDLLLAILDQWVVSIREEAFQQMLPLLRRIFSTFSFPERRQIGAKVRQRTAGGEMVAPHPVSADYRADRGERVIPILQELLGVRREWEGEQRENIEEGER